MKTYKLGNKAKCIIRAYSSGLLGKDTMKWDNQPYTVLEDIEATLYFNNLDGQATAKRDLLNFNVGYVSHVALNKVTLTEKILNLIFKQQSEGLINTTKYLTSNEDRVLYFPHNPVYQVFIYDDTGLKYDLGVVENKGNSQAGIVVDKANYEYLAFFSYDSDNSLSLNENDNVYVTLDLELEGNEDDQTRNAWIHLGKCSVTADRTLFFSKTINTVDLNFVVLDGENYITFE